MPAADCATTAVWFLRMVAMELGRVMVPARLPILVAGVGGGVGGEKIVEPVQERSDAGQAGANRAGHGQPWIVGRGGLGGDLLRGDGGVGQADLVKDVQPDDGDYRPDHFV